jgi:hypothetical protein
MERSTVKQQPPAIEVQMTSFAIYRIICLREAARRFRIHFTADMLKCLQEYHEH